MDKELLRLVIILIGILVMIVMLAWHFYKNFRDRPLTSEEDEIVNETDNEMESDYTDHSSVELKQTPHKKIDLMHKKSSAVESTDNQYFDKTITTDNIECPKLIEFSLLAKAKEGFNGQHLFEEFTRLGLEYGSVRVFERVDKNRLVDFTIACQKEPGTFPEENLEKFYCPGIVFFMQPRELDAPLKVFDDLIETIDELALELDGLVLDHHKKLLTAESIAQYRQMLAPQ